MSHDGLGKLTKDLTKGLPTERVSKHRRPKARNKLQLGDTGKGIQERKSTRMRAMII